MATARVRIGWVVAFVLLAAGVGGLLLWQPGSDGGSSSATTDGGEPIVAQPAPATRPAPVDPPGKCGETMASIRELQRAYPSGAMLPESANRRLTTELARLDVECASLPSLQREFRARELTPWLTYLPPARHEPA